MKATARNKSRKCGRIMLKIYMAIATTKILQLNHLFIKILLSSLKMLLKIVKPPIKVISTLRSAKPRQRQRVRLI